RSGGPRGRGGLTPGGGAPAPAPGTEPVRGPAGADLDRRSGGRPTTGGAVVPDGPSNACDPSTGTVVPGGWPVVVFRRVPGGPVGGASGGPVPGGPLASPSGGAPARRTTPGPPRFLPALVFPGTAPGGAGGPDMPGDPPGRPAKPPPGAPMTPGATGGRPGRGSPPGPGRPAVPGTAPGWPPAPGLPPGRPG